MTDRTDPLAFQVTFDCKEPHVLADWWAEALRWEVEAQDETFIRSMIEQGHATEEETTTHRGRLVWQAGAAIHPPEAPRPRVLFQEVPEEKAGKNRVHLDLHTDPADTDAERERLIGLGATELWAGRQGPHTWVTLADPEGNEFCI
jgi:hypothetical protein